MKHIEKLFCNHTASNEHKKFAFSDFKDEYDLDNNLSKSYSGQIIFKNALKMIA